MPSFRRKHRKCVYCGSEGKNMKRSIVQPGSWYCADRDACDRRIMSRIRIAK